MPKSHSAATELAPLLDGSTAGELIPELVRHGLQQLIELEVAAVLGAERYERSEERLGHRNGYRTGCSPPKWATSTRGSPSCVAAASCRRSWSRAGGWIR